MGMVSPVLRPVHVNAEYPAEGRMRDFHPTSVRFVFAWGFGSWAILFLVSDNLSALFSDNPAVVDWSSNYLIWMGASFAFMGYQTLVGSAVTAVGKGHLSLYLIGIRSFLLILPFAWIGLTYFGERGFFAGIIAAYILASFFAKWLQRQGMPCSHGRSVANETTSV